MLLKFIKGIIPSESRCSCICSTKEVSFWLLNEHEEILLAGMKICIEWIRTQCSILGNMRPQIKRHFRETFLKALHEFILWNTAKEKGLKRRFSFVQLRIDWDRSCFLSCGLKALPDYFFHIFSDFLSSRFVSSTFGLILLHTKNTFTNLCLI